MALSSQELTLIILRYHPSAASLKSTSWSKMTVRAPAFTFTFQDKGRGEHRREHELRIVMMKHHTFTQRLTDRQMDTPKERERRRRKVRRRRKMR